MRARVEVAAFTTDLHIHADTRTHRNLLWGMKDRGATPTDEADRILAQYLLHRTGEWRQVEGHDIRTGSAWEADLTASHTGGEIADARHDEHLIRELTDSPE